jgi:hypothetical protein
MRDSLRYRYKAADCLRAAQQAHDPSHRAIHLSMALSWLSLARQDEAAVWFSKASRTPTISRIYQSRSVTPATIAGVTRSVL